MAWNLVPSAHAQTPSPTCAPGSDTGINLSDCLRLNDDTPVYEQYTSISGLVDLLVSNIFVIAGIVLFAMIIWGGYLYIAKGKKGIEEANGIWTRAIVGMIVMICAYWIVQLVAMITGANILF
jgi:hypothetical protein